MKGKNIAEGVVLGVSLFIVLGLIGYISYHHWTHSQRPPAVAIKPFPSWVRKADNVFYLPVFIQNKSNNALANLWVQISLSSPQSQVESVEMIIDYLPADDEQRRIVMFQNDPRKGTLSYRASFDIP